MRPLSRTANDQPGHRRAKRRWTEVPAPATLRTPFEGAEILDEVPGPLGLLLWQRVRDVLLWSAQPLEIRASLYSDSENEAGGIAALVRDTYVVPELSGPLRILDALCTGPELIAVDPVVSSCLRVVDWATRENYVSTAVHYAEAAFAVRPDDPGLAFGAGRACRRQAAYERAEAWFRRAIYLARGQQDLIAYTDAVLGWGNMEFQRGRFGPARKLYGRAWRTAKKAKVRKLGAAAQHNLLLLAIELRDWDATTTPARLACELYPPDSDRWPYLAHDIALAWMWQGYNAAALQIFVEVFRLIPAPAERLQVWANIGRTAAATGDSTRYFEAVSYVTARTHNPGEFVAASLVNLAEGALCLGRAAQARQLARQGLEVARRRGEAFTAELAEAVLDRSTRPQETKARAMDLPLPDHLHALVDHLMSVLRRIPDPG